MISEIIEKWIKGILIDGITGNLSGLFDNVNAKVGEIASDVGSTPQAWNSGMYHTSDRRRTMARMLAALPDMDTEMRQLANSTIAKLERMTDADFDGQRFDFAGE